LKSINQLSFSGNKGGILKEKMLSYFNLGFVGFHFRRRATILTLPGEEKGGRDERAEV